MTEQTASTRQWIDRVVDALDPASSSDASDEAMEEFARQLLSRASAELLERRDAGQIAEDVASLFSFVAGTGEREIAVRVRGVEDRAHRATLETVMPDCPFIVNTLREYVHARDLSIAHLLHPVLVLGRDEGGRIVDVQDRTAEGVRTSVVHLVVEGQIEPEEPARMEEEIRERLGQVRVATDDFEPMLEKSRDIIRDLEEEKERIPWRESELEEVQELLRWLQDGAFVFLGYREYDLTRPDGEGPDCVIQAVEGSGLGILRDESRSRFADPVPLEELPEDLQARVLGGPLLIVSKTNSESPVHRRARMDYLGIKKVDPDGEITGERRFLGLFTAKAYAQDASSIPILRRKLREILEAEGTTRGSHDYNQILRIFNSMPKEELFLASVSELLDVIGSVMEAEGADEVRVIPRSDPLARGVHVVVMLPQERFSDEVRKKVQAILMDAYRGQLLNYHLTMNEGDQARLHFYLGSELSELSLVNVPELEERIRESVRSWEERLSDALARSHESERAHELADRHTEEFSTEYKATIDVGTAVEDIEKLESLQETGIQQLSLKPVDAARPGASMLKVFAPRGMYVLSDLMPTLENLGLRVLEADKYDVGAGGPPGQTIHTFAVETPLSWGLDRAEAAPRLAETLRAIRASRTGDDRLNSLVLSAGLDWREVALLRCYAGYAFRIGAVSSRAGVRRPLAEHPGGARLLYRIFEARLDPDREEGRRQRTRRHLDQFDDLLDEIRSIEDDRTYRRLLDLILATVRTNFFQERARRRGNGMIALKFRCGEIEVFPEPRPRFEIYVNSGRTEGAHLRMDRVARGGIRWSDRSEDFRVEVLGLVKTQQVKNCVIVPAGAKGAYVVKDPPADGSDLRDAGEASYREFVRGLLDLTDNLVAGEVRHPPDTVVRDGPDPYLVVAADKGTAHLSDTANEIAAEYDFWLGDAFASGGSHGYDHKELGITARGTWECVKRHFRELAMDVDEEPFTVVGIGDMSGDVFGNGMLLSRKTRLVAAFDHRHIFLDPDPDPERSWEERKRLFDAPASSWMDYDETKISEGGGVWGREEKEIPLSPQVRDLLDVEEEVLNGEALIRAVLRADVDLLWNGGIGTYVKASHETHGEVGDPGNDDVRVDADALRASVVGEGGNLGFTQRARVEYALRGGRINTDALDNSGGVDMSDHEVNLKILLNYAMDRGELDFESRNRTLESVTEAVADDVLDNNYAQSLAVSLDENRVREIPAEFRDTLVRLEREGVVDRDLDGLPTTEELVERQEEGRFLTRPELAVMLAASKNYLKSRIAKSDLLDEAALEPLLTSYFPEEAVEAAGGEALEGHWLRGRIIAAELTNRFVDWMGSTGHVELVRETGKRSEAVAGAWYAAYRVSRARRLRERLRELNGVVPTGLQGQWFLDVSEVLERATRWLLANARPEWSVGETVERYTGPVGEARSALPDLLSERRREELDGLRALHQTDGLPEDLAMELASFRYLDDLLPVAELARRHGLDADLVGHVYFGLTDEIDFPWLHEQLGRVSGADLWEQRAAKTLSMQLDAARARISAHILEAMDGGEEVDDALAAFRRRHASDFSRIRQVLGDVQASERASLPSLMVAVHAISNQALARDGER